MKKLLKAAIFFLIIIHYTNLYSQNVMINVATQNSGIVKKGEIVFFEVTINNTSPTRTVPAFKLRPQISFPTTVVDVPITGHTLPMGWEIVSNKKGVVLLTNGTDLIAENQSRTILIAVRGKAKGGPSTIIGNLNFSNGIAPGAVLGSALIGDNNADNTSTSTVSVIK